MQKSTKGKILKSAIDLFAAQGRYGLTMDKLAAAAGVNKSTIFYYFQSKDNLYRMSLKGALADFLTSFEQAIFSDKQQPKTRSMMVRLFFEYVFAHPTFVRLIHWELADGGRYLLQFLEEFKCSPKFHSFYNSIATIWNVTGKSGKDGKTNLEFVRFFGAMFVYPLLRPMLDWLLGIGEADREKFLRQYIEQMEYFEKNVT